MTGHAQVRWLTETLSLSTLWAQSAGHDVFDTETGTS